MGVGLCFTEMVSAKALIYQNKKTHAIMDIRGEEDVCGIQLFGPDPGEMALAAKMAEDRGAKVIDINMGCPVPKVVNNGEGAALLRDIPRALKIAEAVVNAVSVPVTVKLRRGFDKDRNGIALAKELPSVGVQALTMHGRDRTQYYSGKADWEAIADVKQAVSVPVIGNGDIFTHSDAVAMLRETVVTALCWPAESWEILGWCGRQSLVFKVCLCLLRLPLVSGLIWPSAIWRRVVLFMASGWVFAICVSF